MNENQPQTEKIIIDQQAPHTTSTITFSSRFVDYYKERESKIPGCYRELKHLKDEQNELVDREKKFRTKYEKLLTSEENEREKCIELRDKLSNYVGIFKMFKLFSSGTKKFNEFIDQVSSTLDRQNGDDTLVLETNNRSLTNGERERKRSGSVPSKNKKFYFKFYFYFDSLSFIKIF